MSQLQNSVDHSSANDTDVVVSSPDPQTDPSSEAPLTSSCAETCLCCLQETGLYEYKVSGVLSACSPAQCADVYMDLTYRRSWDGYVKGKNQPWLQ